MSAVLQPDVHTSVQAPDLFGTPPPGATDSAARPAACALVFTGTLAHHAEVRTKQLDDHHYVPVVCLDLDNVGAGHHRVHAEQPFTEATRREAEALARRLRKGMSVTVTTGLTEIRLSLPAATISPP